jgi:translocation and assembly module TamB
VVQSDNGRFVLERLTTQNPRLDLDASGTVHPDSRALQARLTLRDLVALGQGLDGAAEARLDYTFRDGRDLVNLVAKARDLSLGNAQIAPLLRGQTDVTAQIARENSAIRIDDLRVRNPQLDITGTGQDAGAGWAFDLAARLANLGVVVPEVPGPVSATARIRDTGARYALQAQVQGPAALNTTLEGTASPDFRRLDLSLRGSLDAAIAGAFAGPNLSLRGPANFDLRLNGAPQLSALSGRVAMSGARLSLTNPPFVFSSLDASADLAGGRAQITASATAQTGGSLQARGSIGLQAPFAADLGITLAALSLRDPMLYATSLTGALRITGPLTGGALIAGDIALGQTDLQIPSTGLGGVASFPDLTHRAEPAAVRRTRGFAGLIESGTAARRAPSRPYGLNIGISAPNRVFIRGRGLDAEMGGQFRITGTTLAPVPAGALTLIRGRLDLLGKRFVFTEGRIGVDGALLPELRLVAITQTDAGEAGIIVEGPADAPEIRFTSALGLPEEEVVARLLFGRGLDQLTPFQAAQLAAAVASLTGRGGAGIMDRLRQGLGLDDFDIGTDDSGDTQLRAGRYLSENIYTDLTVTSGGKSEVSINLDLTPSVTVKGRASSDGQTGLGVFFERDY